MYMLLVFSYLVIVVRPDFYFHHLQPSFLIAPDYLAHYLTYPGGFSELMASLFMQSFYIRLPGSIVFMCIALAIWWLTFELMNTIHRSRLNRLWALVPPALAILMANNYNLPFSVITSVLIVLLIAQLPAKKGNNPAIMPVLYSAGAAMVYYCCGSGYLLLFSVIALLLSMKFRIWESLLNAFYIAGFAFLVPLAAEAFIFPIPPEHRYFFLFPPRLYFMAYEPSWVFYAWLLSVPVLLIIASLMRKAIPVAAGAAVAGIFLLAVTVFGHVASYRKDARNIVASDYHCYHGHAARAARAATSVEAYSFAANLNHNLAIAKAGTLMENFFNFLQISGTDALYPDAEFSLEMSFIAADFYYDLGYISEARHWAHTSLVYYPYSPRALRLLVKVHLVTGEYRAAARCLHILNKGLINRKFVKEYTPCVQDTSLVSAHPEIMEKRSFIPAGKELSPLIDERFRELLEANENNRRAYEYLMLYYLLDSRLERFLEMYDRADRFFTAPVDIFEEAVLMYGELHDIPVEEKYAISHATRARFEQFNQTLRQYEGKGRMARNVLYWEMGRTYMYYLHFVFPRVMKPEIIYPAYEESPI